ncbi:MAG: site-specific integrase [Cyanobacteriota bacterium]
MTHAIQIHAEGKIDIHERTAKLARALERFRNSPATLDANKQIILRFLNDCSLGKTVFGRSKKKIGPARCLKYLNILKQLSAWLGKPFAEVSQQDMEGLIVGLESDQFKSLEGRPFSPATKADIKKAIKKFWKWKDGNNRVYPDLVAWIDSSDQLKDVPALSRAEIEQMIDQTASIRDKALLMVLFDSGARVEELLNVRLKPEHLFWKAETGCYMVRLEYSKTKPRTISLPLSTRLLKAWLEVHPAKSNSQAQLFPLSYGNLRMLVHRNGKRVLGKRVTPHMLRHSSATFYANKLKNRYKLCYRYGWAMSSNMVDRYLDREGLMEEETASAVKGDELTLTSRQSQNLKEELSLLKESYAELLANQDKLRKELDAAQTATGGSWLLKAVLERQQEMADMLEQLSGRKFDVVYPAVGGVNNRTKEILIS